MQSTAMLALHEAAEYYLVELFEWANLCVCVCVCVNSATDVLGLTHDGLPRHRAGLPAHLGAAVNED